MNCNPSAPLALVELAAADEALLAPVEAEAKGDVEKALMTAPAAEEVPVPEAAAEEEEAPGAAPSLPWAAARTVELNWPVMSSSSKRAEKAMYAAVPFEAALVDSMRMKLRESAKGDYASVSCRPTPHRARVYSLVLALRPNIGRNLVVLPLPGNAQARGDLVKLELARL